MTYSLPNQYGSEKIEALRRYLDVPYLHTFV